MLTRKIKNSHPWKIGIMEMWNSGKKKNIRLLKLIKEMTIEDAQKQVDNWIGTYGVRYFNELTNMALLTEEVGELARIIARKYGEQSFKKNEKDAGLDDEMADVLFVLICLENQTGVDLTDAFNKNLVKKTRRDNERHKNNLKL